MTRINLVPPQLLSNQHLIAEHKEILQLNGQFKKSLNNKKGIYDFPKNFKLNKGHVKFFYSRGKYLHKRFELIQEELSRRGYESKSIFDNSLYVENNMYNDWEPKLIDYLIILQRLFEKLETKKSYYKYKDKDFNMNLYKEKIKIFLNDKTV
jgi:deoxyribonuclease (pyrimidine dimer)